MPTYGSVSSPTSTAAAPAVELRARHGPARTYYKSQATYLLLLRGLCAPGSALARALPWGAVAAASTAALHLEVTCHAWPSFCANGHPAFTREDRLFLFTHTYAYQAILLASGFGLVFRLNQSLARYWEARTAVQNMAAKWADAALMALAFDDEPDADGADADERAQFARAAVHLTSLLHATALHMLRCDRTLETLRGHLPLSHAPGTGNSESPALRLCGCGASAGAFAARNPIHLLGGVGMAEACRLEASSERVHVVLGWLTRLLVRRRKRGGLSQAEAPVVSRIYQVLSDGNLWFLGALKVVDTPFPLPYAQLNAAICFVNLAIFPVVVADKVASLPLAIAVAFCAISFLFGLNEVARDLEDPFTTELGFWPGANRLHMPLIQLTFDERLLALGSHASGPWPDDDDARYGAFLPEALGHHRVQEGPGNATATAAPAAAPSAAAPSAAASASSSKVELVVDISN